jgi:hypothetical protein
MLAVGFVYWLAFLLSLEPGNVARAVRAGTSLHWSQETLRILGASLLGCAATPIPLDLVRRFPVEGARWGRNLIVQCICGLALAAGLIVVARVLADAFLAVPRLPFASALGEDMVADGPLVAFCVAGFIALAHAARSRSSVVTPPGRRAAPAAAGYLATIPVRERGRVILVDVANVDWIETQGNYVALHAGAETHLIREPLASLAPRLDPSRFRRVHRRTVVATDRIARIDSLGGGDARLTLKDGTELRLSRTYRASLSPHNAADNDGTRSEEPLTS